MERIDNEEHDEKKCFACTARKGIEPITGQKFDHVIVFATYEDGYHSAISGNPNILNLDQKMKLIHTLAELLHVRMELMRYSK